MENLPLVAALAAGAGVLVGAAFGWVAARSGREAPASAPLAPLLDQIPAHMWVTDRDLNVTYARGRGLTAIGLTPQSALGRSVLEFYPPSVEGEAADEIYRRALGGETRTFRHRAGRQVFEGVVAPLRGDGEAIIGTAGVALNVTERTMIEDELRWRNALLDEAQSVAGLGSWELDVSAEQAWWSPAMEAMLGVPPDDPRPRGHNLYMEFVEEEDRPRVEGLMRAALREGASYVFEHRIRRGDGEVRWVRTAGCLRRSRENRVRRVYGFLQDVTESRRGMEMIQREKAVLEEQVRGRTLDLENAVREISSFNYAVSHDLRQPLRAIAGYIALLEESVAASLGDADRHLMERIHTAVRRMGALIDDLLARSRVRHAPLHREAVDLGAVARSMARELGEREPERRVEWTIADGAMAQADAGLVRVVLENLLDNALKFTRGRDPALIEFGVEGDVDEEREAPAGASEGAAPPAASGTRTFFVRDNGAGFDATQARRLFQPFQRLHEPDEFEGTGIGLATVARIVRRHGGEIDAVGSRGRGATFRFTLPPPGAPPAS
jgi:PAS domain S-box-containing protein